MTNSQDTNKQQQEPPTVAELLCVCGAVWEWRNRDWELVATPPASKPLTDEQIDRAIAELGLNYLADAANNRAVLRELCRKAAHGIKGDA